jgi:hypothetical protein
LAARWSEGHHGAANLDPRIDPAASRRQLRPDGSGLRGARSLDDAGRYEEGDEIGMPFTKTRAAARMAAAI